MALTREADLMETVPGMSLSPAETEHRAGQACSPQPEPHALLSRPGLHVCCTPPPVHVSNPPSPQASGSGPPKQEKQQINHFMHPSVSSRRGPSGPLSIMDPGLPINVAPRGAHQPCLSKLHTHLTQLGSPWLQEQLRR